MTPDFDQLAIDLATRAGRGDILPHVKEALRQVWNARGAADIAAVDGTFGEMWATVGPMIPGTDPHPPANIRTVSRAITGALRKLDR
jgi:hypothetical protein